MAEYIQAEIFEKYPPANKSEEKAYSQRMNIKDIEDEILEQYSESDGLRPWIVGFSGGKDSTMLLQLVWL